ncbi:2OG-Fe(II) oxygenase [Marinomonas sp. C2222]|uniref:2OG-Fe(II) oxygenase n=1 Tax=Marinomonas sargassi TaxID=2984494 RepID=A0ABT2YRH8_9GAMM|nr:2OG-Fe(II) oxygenase [Marinomonas sargassi]MCV2402499.1 2OG-Fe(II) oxygenase [Marinomonas sargassi]
MKYTTNHQSTPTQNTLSQSTLTQSPVTQGTVAQSTTAQTPLLMAQNLVLPSREEMLQRAPSVQHFWDSNRNLLADAWQEWEAIPSNQLNIESDLLLDEKLRAAVTQAWREPAIESEVENLWQEVSTDVYQSQFFDPEQIVELRNYLDKVAASEIPMRPPYGIVLNRYGAMLDPRSEGYLAAPSFQKLYRKIVDEYMRPIARLLFPEIVGYDTQSFGFSIQYQAGKDTSLRLHTDASSVTLNININLPDEEFAGSEVDFYDPSTGKVNRLSFKPGTAMIHRGNVAHAAQPITSGTRSNLVLWLYGDRMQIPNGRNQNTSIDAAQRWTTPTSKQDTFAPF